MVQEAQEEDSLHQARLAGVAALELELERTTLLEQHLHRDSSTLGRQHLPHRVLLALLQAILLALALPAHSTLSQRSEAEEQRGNQGVLPISPP